MAGSPEKKKRPMSSKLAKEKAKSAGKAMDALKERRSPKAEAKPAKASKSTSPEKAKRPMSKNVAEAKAKSAGRAMDALKARREDGKPGKGKVEYKYSVEPPKKAETKPAKPSSGKVTYDYKVDPTKAPEKSPLRAPKMGPAAMDSAGGTRTAAAVRAGAKAIGGRGAAAMLGRGAAMLAAPEVAIPLSVAAMLAPTVYEDLTTAESKYKELKARHEGGAPVGPGMGMITSAHAQEQERRMAPPKDKGINPSARPPAPQRTEVENSLPTAQSVRDGVTGSTRSPATPSAGGVQTKGGLYPIYDKGSTEAKSFRSRFAEERGKGSSEFEWQGRKYNTKTKEDN